MSAPQSTRIVEHEQASSIQRALEKLRQYYADIPILGPLTGLVLLVIFFTIRSPVFFTGNNFTNIFLQVMEVGTLAVGQTIIIITAGIDLSAGAIMVFGSVLMAKLAVGGNGIAGAASGASVPQVAVPIAIIAGLALTTGLGLVNGVMVARFRLPPFIVTLGMLSIAFSSTLLFTGSSAVDNLPSGLLFTGNSLVLGPIKVQAGPLIMIVVVAAMWYALTQTAWGKHVYAVGNNIEAARLTGINTTRLLLSVYVIAGLIYGIAALLVLGRTTIGDPQAGQTDNLDSITAVVIGGTSLFGGRGSVIGTLIGALIVGVIRNGLTLIGVDALWQTFATGVIVILAVAVDQATRRQRR
jgi:fructose transport system permease protein